MSSTTIFLAAKRDPEKEYQGDPDLSSWFAYIEPLEDDGMDRDEQQEMAIDVLDHLEKWLKKHGSAMRATPAGTGSLLLEHLLPGARHNEQWVKYSPLPEELQVRIRANLTPACVQFMADGPVSDIYNYDARLAYLSCCQRVPCFFGGDKVSATAATGGIWDVFGNLNVTHDNSPFFEPWKRGFYRIDVTVPEGWDHVGLVPKKVKGQLHPDYPRKPGESWEAWVTSCELPLLQKDINKLADWPYVIRERIMFQNDGSRACNPLKRWMDMIGDEIERLDKATPTLQRKMLRSAFRDMALQTIGLFESRGTKTIRVGPMEAVPDEVPAWADMWPDEDSQDFLYSWPVPHRGMNARFDHPEWAAMIKGKCRYHTLRRALERPRGDVLGVYTDGLYLRSSVPSWGDTGAIGQYRLKGVKHLKAPITPKNWTELLAVM